MRHPQAQLVQSHSTIILTEELCAPPPLMMIKRTSTTAVDEAAAIPSSARFIDRPVLVVPNFKPLHQVPPAYLFPVAVAEDDGGEGAGVRLFELGRIVGAGGGPDVTEGQHDTSRRLRDPHITLHDIRGEEGMGFSLV